MYKYSDNKTESNRAFLNKKTAEFRLAKKTFLDSQMNAFIENLGRHPTSSRPFWQRINRFRNGKKVKKSQPLQYGDNLLTGDQEIANAFACDFGKVFSFDANNQKFDNSFLSTVNASIHAHCDKNEPAPKIALRQINLAELKEAIRKLENSCSSGPDGVTNTMLKNLGESFMVVLLRLINISMRDSKIPRAWKLSNITMIPKKPDSSLQDPQNYRPISLTSVLSKLTERLVSSQIIEYIESKNIMCAEQSVTERTEAPMIISFI